MSDPILSPSQSSHPLPPRPSNGSLTDTAAMASASQSSTPAPKTRGGFELDDEGDDQDINNEDAQDDDVYNAQAPSHMNGSTGDQNGLDRSPKSPTQENGMTPVPAQASDSPANVPSSAASNFAQSQPVLTSNGAAFPGQSSSTDAPSVLPKSRMAHDVVGILEDRIKDDPRGDTAAWLELIQEFKDRSKDDQVRRTYERYLEHFPLAAEQWCAWLRWEDQANRSYQVEQIFKKALMPVLSVDLYSIYINHVRRRHPMTSGDTTQAYKIINQTFEFALKQVGADKDSGSIWQDYINFLKTGAGTVGGTGWQDSQKMDITRDAYRRALSVPTQALQQLWKEYESFEMGISKINGRKQMQERSADYMTARTAYTHLQNVTKQIYRTTQPRLPPAIGFSGDIEYRHQVELWQHWIQWEKDDHLALKDDTPNDYLDRVIFTYKQALMALQFWPDMWYDAAEFCMSSGREDAGLSLLNQGFVANPESPLLAFKLADRLESTTSNDNSSDPGAKQRMKIVREPYDRVLDALYDVRKKTETRMQLEMQRIELSASTQQGQDGDDAEINASNVAEKKAIVDAQLSAVKSANMVHLDTLSNTISHAWIALMRSTRRIQGKGLPGEKGPAGFRAVFNEARKRGHLTPEFYVEAAQIEWNCYRDATGTKIFERGVKLYPNNGLLPLEYIKHLINKDDMTNARAVFETTVNRFTSSNSPTLIAQSKHVFSFFHEYESKYGELSQIVKLEGRMRELFPDDPTLRQFSSRYSTSAFDPMSAQPVVSPTQVLPKALLHPSLEAGAAINSPIQHVIDHITHTNSPKRPLPIDDDEEDERPQKMARGESPRAPQIRKIPQSSVSTRAAPPAPAPLPPAIVHLLSILPRASSYTDIHFDAIAIQKLIREKHLPAPTSVGATRPPPPQPTPSAQGWPPQFTPQQPPMMIPPPQSYAPQGTPTSQFGAAPFRYP